MQNQNPSLNTTNHHESEGSKSRWPRLLRRPAVAEYLSVSDRYVDALVASGYIPGPKLAPSSRCVLWDRSEIDQWLDETTAEPTDTLRSFDDIIASESR